MQNRDDIYRPCFALFRRVGTLPISSNNKVRRVGRLLATLQILSDDLSRRSRATLPEGESFLSRRWRATLIEGESFFGERGHFCHYILNLPLYIFFTIVLPILAC